MKWTKRGRCWTSWFSPNGTNLLLSGSSSCCMAHTKHQDKCSQTGWLPTRSPVLKSCPMQPISGTKEQTIEQRSHISQTDSDSAGWNASSQHTKHSGLCLPSAKIGNMFALSCHSVSAANYRELLNRSLGIWASVTQAAAVR